MSKYLVCKEEDEMKRWLSLIFCLIALSMVLIPVQAQAAVSRSEMYYTVQAGDSLIRIAVRYGVSVSNLAAANGLSWNSWVYAGQRLTIPGVSNPAPAPTTGSYVVRVGDTMTSIALRYGISASQLASANGLYWNSWVYVGQRLSIPGQTNPTTPPPTTPADTYVVQAGNTLFSIAKRYGTTVSALQAANSLRSYTIYVGQRLVIPGSGTVPQNPSPNPSPEPEPNSGKWIDVNLSQQRITAYEGQTAVYSALVSTGTWQHPTVVGTYSINVKYRYTPMSGPGYYLPNVPHTMYFYGGYAIHGAYWHNNFGTPMSHGCVNLSLGDAEWFYNWAPVGTKVVSHY
ncbi:MAG: LysM peptidoglycan-binding domain-containing protein [Anaerolineales bacterium]|nr:MAG: LysM peptidoglycan-binding domain-containing protein [Anaerolineales bacterium]